MMKDIYFDKKTKIDYLLLEEKLKKLKYIVIINGKFKLYIKNLIKNMKKSVKFYNI